MRRRTHSMKRDDTSLPCLCVLCDSPPQRLRTARMNWALAERRCRVRLPFLCVFAPWRLCVEFFFPNGATREGRIQRKDAKAQGRNEEPEDEPPPRSPIGVRHQAALGIPCYILGFLMACDPAGLSLGGEPTPEAYQSSPELYDGQTLDAWRERIKSLDLQSPEAAAAVPGLIAIVEDEAAPWFTRRQSALTLGRIGAPAVRAVPILERYAVAPAVDGDASTPLWAVKSLALFGPVAAPATPTLARLANDSGTDHSVRLMSIEALGRVGIAHPLALPAMIALLQSREPLLALDRDRPGVELDLVVACVECLEMFRASGETSVPVLLRYSEDHEERVRRAVAVTLGAIGPRANDAASRLAEMVVADRSLDVRDVAAVSLGQVGGTDRLTRILKHPEPETRARATTGLGDAPSPDSATNEALATARTDESPLVRMAAIEATQRLRPNPRLTAPAAAKEIAAPDRQVRLRAIRFLTKLGTKATPAIPVLEQLRNHPESQVRQSAEKLLEALPMESM
jgi:HEAT repeat protein